jgi:hypothetical protein
MAALPPKAANSYSIKSLVPRDGSSRHSGTPALRRPSTYNRSPNKSLCASRSEMRKSGSSSSRPAPLPLPLLRVLDGQGRGRQRRVKGKSGFRRTAFRAAETASSKRRRPMNAALIPADVAKSNGSNGLNRMRPLKAPDCLFGAAPLPGKSNLALPMRGMN